MPLQQAYANRQNVIHWKDNLTPVSDVFDDIYYAEENGFEESNYVFLQKNVLPARWTENPFIHRIGELGFGTGLNFLSASKLWLETGPQSKTLHYYSCEKFPLSRENMQKAVSPWPNLQSLSSDLIREYPENNSGQIEMNLFEGRVKLFLFIGDVLDFLESIPCSMDTWFFDGFAPKKNPDMWSESVFERVAEKSSIGTRFSTYASAGFVRRNLKNFGFDVQKTAGFGRKREMLVGQFL